LKDVYPNTGHGSSIMHWGEPAAIKLAKCGNELGKISTMGKIFSAMEYNWISTDPGSR
jgi:hypothetical protein